MKKRRLEVHPLLKNRFVEYCTKCGAALKPDLKFCTQCGHPVPSKEEAVYETIYEPEDLEPGMGKRYTTIKYGLLLLMCLGAFAIFKYYEYNGSTSGMEGGGSISMVGEYFDDSGYLLGSPEKLITINRKGEVYEGSGDNGNLKMTFTPKGANTYEVVVVHNRVPADFEAQYNHEEGKLTFFNSLAQSTWYLTQKR